MPLETHAEGTCATSISFIHPQYIKYWLKKHCKYHAFCKVTHYSEIISNVIGETATRVQSPQW